MTVSGLSRYTEEGDSSACRVTNPAYRVINEITAGGEKDSHVESHLRDLWL